MNQNYLVIDASNTVTNVILWDGIAPYALEDCTLEPQPDGVWIGWTRNADGVWSAPTDNSSE
jgi:hypothetical protein